MIFEFMRNIVKLKKYPQTKVNNDLQYMKL